MKLAALLIAGCLLAAGLAPAEAKPRMRKSQNAITYQSKVKQAKKVKPPRYRAQKRNAKPPKATYTAPARAKTHRTSR